jgi:hypothetical protein
MQSPTIGDRVTAATPTGAISGRIVGHEFRDVSKGGNGREEKLVCVAPYPGQLHDTWQWVRAAAVEPLEP